MKIYTIGFTKKDAEEFFGLLDKNNVTKLLDIRLNNASQLSGFAKGNDLRYFLKKILEIGYEHDIRFAPTKELFDNYKEGKITWQDFELNFKELINKRNLKKIILDEYFEQLDGICLLCSEDKATYCHRRLVAEFIKEFIPDLEIIHL